MKFSQFAKWVIKAVIACMIAFAIVSGGCLLYYNIPLHSFEETTASDFKWQPSRFYSRGTEGFAYGKTDSNGYNNEKDLSGSDIDILFTGSSHGEAFNVAQNENCVSRLNHYFNGEMTAYNIAVSGQTLANLCRNLEGAIKEYKPRKYVILECQSVTPSLENIKAAVDGTLPKIEKESGKLAELLQGIPYLRLLYMQLSNIQAANETPKANDFPEVPDSEYIAAIKSLIAKVKIVSMTYGVEPIIVYHPHVLLNTDGTIRLEQPERTEYVSMFSYGCTENGVKFVDMTDDIFAGYSKDYRLPHGFSNTQAGTGHLNAYGHDLVAKRLYETIKDMEAEK